jgi:RNA polymerase sigma-32 factor
MVASEPVSLSDLGDRFKVSKERIRQVEARLRKRLKTFLEQELGDEIDFEFATRG